MTEASLRSTDPLSVIPETDFHATVVALGRLHGWIVGYTHDSRRSEPGEPDLRMVHEEWRRVIFAECKDQDGQLTPGRHRGTGRSRRWLPGQDDWARALKACPGVEYYLWRPSDSDLVEAILSNPRLASRLYAGNPELPEVANA